MLLNPRSPQASEAASRRSATTLDVSLLCGPCARLCCRQCGSMYQGWLHSAHVWGLFHVSLPPEPDVHANPVLPGGHGEHPPMPGAQPLHEHCWAAAGRVLCHHGHPPASGHPSLLRALPLQAGLRRVHGAALHQQVLHAWPVRCGCRVAVRGRPRLLQEEAEDCQELSHPGARSQATAGLAATSKRWHLRRPWWLWVGHAWPPGAWEPLCLHSSDWTAQTCRGLGDFKMRCWVLGGRLWVTSFTSEPQFPDLRSGSDDTYRVGVMKLRASEKKSTQRCACPW